jgi:hypothetical protein
VSEQEIQGVGGPFVTVATFCERILEEKDGVFTLVRIIDRYHVESGATGLTPPGGAKAGLKTFLLVIIKAGDFVGDATVSLKVRHPSGQYGPKPISIPVTFTQAEGPESGIALQVEMGFGLEETGLYWADVEVDGKLLTRVPVRVEFRSKPTPEQASPDGPQ